MDRLMEEIRQDAVEEGRRARAFPLRTIVENEYNSNNNNNHTKMMSRSQKIINTELSLGRLRAMSHRKTLKLSRKHAGKRTGSGTQRKHSGRRRTRSV